ncbi:zinc transporter ZntB [Maribius pontilimi]|uniref:Zinc transporter ZntB n=1 Tax=Palleronia pontilimi TaxID=1964209 RepID=A0A934MID4_9RHOB|nr:zinc transporter ZntB [Palleronia pontilimi]MBJ3764149.1 zinc transporter ZntB [Palleronia pontilimi]
MDDHVVFAHHLAGTDRGRPIDSDADIARALRDDAPAWLHLSADHPDTTQWIDEHLSYLDPAIRAALIEPQVRPRALKLGEGLLVILRGINLNEGADPEDTISLRLYADPSRIVSMSRRRLQSVDVLAESIAGGKGPETSGAFLAQLVELLTDRIEEQVSDLDARSEALEAAVIEAPLSHYGSETTDQRLELADLRRVLPPQRDAVRDILRANMAWVGDPQRAILGEQLDQLTRVVETLDAIRDQLATIRTEIDAARDERLNRNLYVLSMISAVFLPLGFMTGLMGINLAGMPGAAWPPAFWVFCGLMAGLAIVVLAILRAFRLL